MPPNQYPELRPLDQPSEYRGTDYLDQIATKQQVAILKPWQVGGLIGIVLLILAVILFFIFTSSGPSQPERYTEYIHRAQALRDITNDNRKIVQDSSLSGINASISSVLGTASQEGEMLSSNAGVDKLQKAGKNDSITSEFTKLESTLNDARLNAVFDQTYSREVGFQLSKLQSTIKTLKSSTKNPKLHSYYEKTNDNINSFIPQLREFNK